MPNWSNPPSSSLIKWDSVLSFGGGGLPRAMDTYVPSLRGKVIIEEAGQCVQVEWPSETTKALPGFLESVARTPSGAV